MPKLSFKKNSIAVISLILLKATSAQGQIIPDRSVDSRVKLQGNTFLIENGATRGSNLFHSFQDFSVPTGGTAYFNNAASIQNIFSRVTGTSVSSIDGTLQANGTASLFLVNPNGIIFGENARLDIGGSFLGTTANNIQFMDGTQFSAIAPQSPPLLTVAAPVGLQLGSNSGDIRVRNSGHQLSDELFSPILRNNTPSGLQVSPGQTLALVGGDVSLNGGIMFAPGGQIEVGSVKQGQVTIDTTSPQWSFVYQPENTLGRIELSNKSLLDTSGNGGATLRMHGHQIILKEDSVVLMQNQGGIPDQGLVLEAADLIDISSANAVSFGAVQTGIYSEAINSGSGTPITISSPTFAVREGGALSSRTYSSAKGGDLTIEAPTYLNLKGASPINPLRVSIVTALAFNSGAAGDVNITTSHLDIKEGGRLSSATLGQGAGGKVRILADLVEVTGFEPRSMQGSTLTSESLGSANAGSLAINTSRLILANGGTVNTSITNSGNGGNLEVNAREYIEVRGNPEISLPTSISANAIQVSPVLRQALKLPPFPSGNSGSVTINTPRLNVTEGGLIAVRNEGTGDAGELTISANKINLDKNSLISATTLGGEGGNISFSANFILLRDSAITASASKQGKGGNISFNTDLFVALGKSSLTAEAEEGQGGDITIIAKAVFLGPDVDVSVSSDAGLQASGTFRVVVEETDLDETTAPAPDIVSAPKVSSVCNPSGKVSEFVVLGSGGLQKDTQTHSSKALKWKAGSSDITTIPPKMEAPSSPLVEAKGWQKLEDGKFKLIANPQDSSSKLATHPTPCTQPS